MDQEEVNNTTSAPAEASKKKVTKKKEAKPKKVKTEVDTAPETTESAPQEATETPKTEPDTTAPDAPVDGATPADGAPATETKKKRRSKRKKSATDAAAGTPNQPKIAKESDAAESAGTETKEGETPTTEVKKKKKNRWILFVGNLPYDADKEMIEGHFEPCGRIVGVRLLTEKDSNKSRGCAFVELDCAATTQKALLLHHSLMGNRKIRVELTAGGGGNGQKRLDKIKAKNEKLKLERQEYYENKVKPLKDAKLAGSKPAGGDSAAPASAPKGGDGEQKPSHGAGKPPFKKKWNNNNKRSAGDGGGFKKRAKTDAQ